MSGAAARLVQKLIGSSGTFLLTSQDTKFIAKVSGNAKQRRLIVRRWKKLGWNVEQAEQAKVIHLSKLDWD